MCPLMIFVLLAISSIKDQQEANQHLKDNEDTNPMKMINPARTNLVKETNLVKKTNSIKQSINTEMMHGL